MMKNEEYDEAIDLNELLELGQARSLTRFTCSKCGSWKEYIEDEWGGPEEKSLEDGWRVMDEDLYCDICSPPIADPIDHAEEVVEIECEVCGDKESIVEGPDKLKNWHMYDGTLMCTECYEDEK